MRRKKNSAITLIEILLVMSIIALVIGTVQFGFHAFLKEEAFVQESAKIKKAILFAQEVMMDTKSDLTLTLVHDENQIHMHFSSSKELPEKILYPLRECSCKEVHTLFFNTRREKEITLRFEGHLGYTTEGLITLESKKGKKQNIVLRGFPGSVL